jgi:hypothetical protein
VLHRSELSPDQRQQTRTHGQAWFPIQANNHCFDVTKRQAQRAGAPDEAQPLHARLVVLSISRCRAVRGRQHANLLIEANCLGCYARCLCELTDGESVFHRRTSLFDMGRHDRPSSYWKVKENLGSSPEGTPLRTRPAIQDARAHCHVFFPWYNAERHLAEQRVAARAMVLTAAYAAYSEGFPAGLPQPSAVPVEIWISHRDRE